MRSGWPWQQRSARKTPDGPRLVEEWLEAIASADELDAEETAARWHKSGRLNRNELTRYALWQHKRLHRVGHARDERRAPHGWARHSPSGRSSPRRALRRRGVPPRGRRSLAARRCPALRRRDRGCALDPTHGAAPPYARRAWAIGPRNGQRVLLAGPVLHDGPLFEAKPMVSGGRARACQAVYYAIGGGVMHLTLAPHLHGLRDWLYVAARAGVPLLNGERRSHC